MTNFIQFVNNISLLNKEASDDLMEKLTTKTFNKGQYLLRSGQVCQQLFFIDNGLVKTFFKRNDKEFIMRFFTENSMFTVLDSYCNQSPSTFEIIALAPITVTYVNQNDLKELCTKHHCLETFFGRLACAASVNMMKRISEMLEENPAQRYNNFVKENTELLQSISLSELANYLGITQVSLSRIRARR